jgi:hypothetical protein
MLTDLSQDRAVAAWVRHQGLGARADAALADVVAATGWIRTLGGVDAYVSLAARASGVTVAGVHAAVAARDLQVVPAARGCIYLVPRQQVPLALALAHDLSARRNERDLEKAGSSVTERQQVEAAVLQALEAGPATTPALRKRLPDGVLRSFGDAGMEVGLTSALGPALRALECAGRVSRQVIDGRLDHERYAWTMSQGADGPDPRPAAERDRDLARVFLRAFAPADPAAFADWSGLTKTRAKAAFAALGLMELRVGGGAMAVLPDQAAALGEPAPSAPRLLSGLDNLLVWHGGPAAFVHPEDHDRPLSVWGRQKGRTWGTVKHALSRVVLAGGVVRGLWEWDAAAGEVVTGPYAPGLPPGIDAAPLTALLSDIGHARAFSIEKDDTVARRAAEVRAL